MRKKSFVTLLVAAALLSAKAPPANRTFPLQSGGKISISATNGSVEILGWDRESVELSGIPENDGSLKIIADGNNLSIRGLTGDNGEPVRIRVPRRVSLDGVASSNGAIRVGDVEGDIRLESSNGQIEAVNVRGSLNIHSSNGAVEVGALDSAAVEIHSSNGAITVRMPASLTANLSAHSSNGSIQSEVGIYLTPVEVRGDGL